MRKLSEFDPDQPIYCSNSKDIAIDSDQTANVSADVPYTQTGYIPKSISVKKNAPVMLTQNHTNRNFQEDGICNGNLKSMRMKFLAFGWNFMTSLVKSIRNT